MSGANQPAGDPTAADLMSTALLTVPATETVPGTWDLLIRTAVHHVPVTADGRCVGILDDRRIALAALSDPLARVRCVGELLSGPVPQVPADAPLTVLAAELLASGCDAVVVHDESYRLVGLVTVHDVLRALVSRRARARAPGT